MKTYTLDFGSTTVDHLDGKLHSLEQLIEEGTNELLLQNIGPRVIAVLGFERVEGMSFGVSQKIRHVLGKTGISFLQRIKTPFLKKEQLIFSVTPGKIDEVSIADADLMEEALKDAVQNSIYLLGDVGSIRAFQTVKERALDRPVIHSELYEDLMRLLVSHRLNITEIKQFEAESEKDIHPWQEIIRNIFQTEEGRKFWRMLRPIYLARKQKEEEYELSEFRAIHRRFQSILATFRPSQLFIGTTSDVGRLEIIARHLAKSAGDFDSVFGGQAVQTLHPLENSIPLDTFRGVPPANSNI